MGGKGRVDYLTEDGAQMSCGKAFHLALNTAEAVGEELAKIPACTVGAEEAKVMDMSIAAFVRLTDILGIYLIKPVFLCKCLTDVVIQTVYTLLHVCIFLDSPVLITEVIAEHAYGCTDKSVYFSCGAALVTIKDICLCGFCMTVFDEHFFDYILNVLNFRSCVALKLERGENIIGEGEGGAFLRKYEDDNGEELDEKGLVASFYTHEGGKGFVNDEMIGKIMNAVLRHRYRSTWGREMPEGMLDKEPGAK